MGLVRITPLVFGRLGPEVGLKLENLQRTGSFKLRGAVRVVASLTPAERKAGLVAASAGNHGAGMALACEGVPLTVVVPEGAPEVKRAAIAASGARVMLRGATYDEAEAAARAIARERGARFVSPFDDEHVIEGNGSDLAREILEQAPGVKRVVAPVGGGGLIGGLGRVLAPRGVEVIGVQTEVNCAMFESLRGGHALTRYRGRPTIAEGCEGAVAELTFDLVRQHVRQVALVPEAAIRRAVAWLYRVAGTIAEPTGAVAVAGMLAGEVQAAPDGMTVVVVSGGNIDPVALDRILHTELVGLDSSPVGHRTRREALASWFGRGGAPPRGPLAYAPPSGSHVLATLRWHPALRAGALRQRPLGDPHARPTALARLGPVSMELDVIARKFLRRTVVRALQVSGHPDIRRGMLETVRPSGHSPENAGDCPAPRTFAGECCRRGSRRIRASSGA